MFADAQVWKLLIASIFMFLLLISTNMTVFVILNEGRFRVLMFIMVLSTYTCATANFVSGSCHSHA